MNPDGIFLQIPVCLLRRLGGAVVNMLAIGPMGRGSNPAKAMDF
jgi:hypothetical protein